MLQSLTLGKKTFPVNLIQGPLAGVSCAPFRLLTWRYSRPAFSCTEMMSCKTLIHQPDYARSRYIYKDPEEGPVCFQLSGSDPLELGQAVRIATDAGADVIDLNCGCPVKKIRSKGAGSSLLQQPAKLYQLIRAMKANTHVPVSVKIRVDNEDERHNSDVVKAISDADADFVVVHGRHWTERYDVPCRYDAIQYFVEAMPIPVIGNGDIACVASLKRMLATGCAGVMIARAGVGQPWLIKQLIAKLQHEAIIQPSFVERGEVFLEHVERLADLLQSERFAILQARKFAKYYARSCDWRHEFIEQVNVCDSLVNLRSIITGYFN